MKEFTYVITEPVGIHARPAGLLAKAARECAPTIITITKGKKTVKASQLLMLMGLGAKKGDEVIVRAEGPDEEAAIAKMETFFKENL